MPRRGISRIEDLRRLVAAGTRHLSLQHSDREEIVGNAVLRVQNALARKMLASESELQALLAMNVRWAIEDFCREIVRRMGREMLTAPVEIPETPIEAAEPAIERRMALEDLVAPLNRRDREIVIERAVFDFDSRETAERHHISDDAARAAYSRASRRLRETLRESGAQRQATAR